MKLTDPSNCQCPLAIPEAILMRPERGSDKGETEPSIETNHARALPAGNNIPATNRATAQQRRRRTRILFGNPSPALELVAHRGCQRESVGGHHAVDIVLRAESQDEVFILQQGELVSCDSFGAGVVDFQLR